MLGRLFKNFVLGTGLTSCLFLAATFIVLYYRSVCRVETFSIIDKISIGASAMIGAACLVILANAFFEKLFGFSALRLCQFIFCRLIFISKSFFFPIVRVFI